MQLFRHMRPGRAAYIAALVLLLQALVSAWATGAMAGVTYDAFGNPLCVTSSDGRAESPPGDHGKMPNCCTLGCSVAAPVLAVPTAEVAAILAPPRVDAGRAIEPEPSGLRLLDHDPASPRAPPLTA